jgi:hypothetical protein
MDDQTEHALGENETPDVVMEEDFNLKQFLGQMGRKSSSSSSKRPPTTRRRIEELGEQRNLRAVISDSWED